MQISPQTLAQANSYIIDIRNPPTDWLVDDFALVLVSFRRGISNPPFRKIHGLRISISPGIIRGENSKSPFRKILGLWNTSTYQSVASVKGFRNGQLVILVIQKCLGWLTSRRFRTIPSIVRGGDGVPNFPAREIPGLWILHIPSIAQKEKSNPPDRY